MQLSISFLRMLMKFWTEEITRTLRKSRSQVTSPLLVLSEIQLNVTPLLDRVPITVWSTSFRRFWEELSKSTSMSRRITLHRNSGNTLCCSHVTILSTPFTMISPENLWKPSSSNTVAKSTTISIQKVFQLPFKSAPRMAKSSTVDSSFSQAVTLPTRPSA